MHGRITTDRGATAVEVALIAPIVFLLLFGVIEMGGVLRSYSSAEGGTRAGGRVAAVAGNDPMTDALALARIAKESTGLGRDAIEVIVIWNATGPGDSVPPACLPADTDTPNGSTVGVSDGGVDNVGACNVYIRPNAPGGVFSLLAGPDPEARFGCQGTEDPEASQKLDCAWPGKNRRVLTTPRTAVGTPDPSDFVGVYVRVHHLWFTGMFGKDLTLTSSTIHLLEPQGFSF